MGNLENRVEKLERRCPARDQLIVYIRDDEHCGHKLADAERRAQEEGRDLLVLMRTYISPGEVGNDAQFESEINTPGHGGICI